MKQLNSEMKKFGIEFPVKEIQFGKSVHMLDLFVYVEENNVIQYKGYSKPRSVFNAIPYLQILRTLRNNSKPESVTTELDLCLNHFENSGYQKERLEELKQKALNKTNEVTNNKDECTSIVFPVHFFDGIQELKDVVHSLDDEIRMLIGDVRILFAMKKRNSIGNSVVRNKQLSIPRSDAVSQRCNGGGCRQCPSTINDTSITINNVEVRIPKSLNCKSRHVIYSINR